MLIGGDFNGKCELLLLRAAELSSNEPETKVSVEELNKELGFERKEIRNYLEYLNDRGFIKLDSIGGPLLYGHISITKKGAMKVDELGKK